MPSVRMRNSSTSSMPPRIFTIGVTIQPDGNGEAPPAVDPDADAAASSANAMTTTESRSHAPSMGLAC